MQSIPTLVRHLLSPDDALYECRNCGRTVDTAAEPCPNCGADEIAEYHVD
jgi:rubrerythrin